MWLLFILSCTTLVLGSSITNGTCYYKSGSEADSIYSPCGNTIDGHQYPCCQLEDKCNDHNACTRDFGNGTIYTYVAGCTDINYRDGSCPNKGDFSDYQWVGLAWEGCTVSDGKVNWVGCQNDGSATVRVSPQSEDCKCHDNDEALLPDTPTGLVAMGYLPASKMGEISWEAGWQRTDPVVPSTSSADDAVETSSPADSNDDNSNLQSQYPATTSSSSPSSTDSSTTGDSAQTAAASSATSAAAGSGGDNSSSGLSPGSKTGIGVSIGLLGSLAGLGIFVFARRLREQRKQEKEHIVNYNNQQDQEKNISISSAGPAMLDAVSTQRSSNQTGQKSELPGTPADRSFMSTASPNAKSSPPKEEYDIVYRPFRYQSVDAEANSDSVRLNGWSTDPYYHTAPFAYYRRNDSGGTGGGQDDGVHELPGSSPDRSANRDVNNQGQ